ncbi:MAG: hypothetical protein GEV07_20550 [Streptosporangiales bacterium]|nr:hypothetical protein [Streptosporangiales bacterium]
MTTHDESPNNQKAEPFEAMIGDTVLRLVTADNLPSVYEAFDIAQHVARMLVDRLVQAGYPVQCLKVVAPSVRDDGRPVVWVHVDDSDNAHAGLLPTGGAGPPPPP